MSTTASSPTPAPSAIATAAALEAIARHYFLVDGEVWTAGASAETGFHERAIGGSGTSACVMRRGAAFGYPATASMRISPTTATGVDGSAYGWPSPYLCSTPRHAQAAVVSSRPMPTTSNVLHAPASPSSRSYRRATTSPSTSRGAAMMMLTSPLALPDAGPFFDGHSTPASPTAVPSRAVRGSKGLASLSSSTSSGQPRAGATRANVLYVPSRSSVSKANTVRPPGACLTQNDQNLVKTSSAQPTTVFSPLTLDTHTIRDSGTGAAAAAGALPLSPPVSRWAARGARSAAASIDSTAPAPLSSPAAQPSPSRGRRLVPLRRVEEDHNRFFDPSALLLSGNLHLLQCCAQVRQRQLNYFLQLGTARAGVDWIDPELTHIRGASDGNAAHERRALAFEHTLNASEAAEVYGADEDDRVMSLSWLECSRAMTRTTAKLGSEVSETRDFPSSSEMRAGSSLRPGEPWMVRYRPWQPLRVPTVAAASPISNATSTSHSRHRQPASSSRDTSKGTASVAASTEQDPSQSSPRQAARDHRTEGPVLAANTADTVDETWAGCTRGERQLFYSVVPCAYANYAQPPSSYVRTCVERLPRLCQQGLEAIRDLIREGNARRRLEHVQQEGDPQHRGGDTTVALNKDFVEAADQGQEDAFSEGTPVMPVAPGRSASTHAPQHSSPRPTGSGGGPSTAAASAATTPSGSLTTTRDRRAPLPSGASPVVPVPASTAGAVPGSLNAHPGAYSPTSAAASVVGGTGATTANCFPPMPGLFSSPMSSHSRTDTGAAASTGVAGASAAGSLAYGGSRNPVLCVFNWLFRALVDRGDVTLALLVLMEAAQTDMFSGTERLAVGIARLRTCLPSAQLPVVTLALDAFVSLLCVEQKDPLYAAEVVEDMLERAQTWLHSGSTYAEVLTGFAILRHVAMHRHTTAAYASALGHEEARLQPLMLVVWQRLMLVADDGEHSLLWLAGHPERRHQLVNIAGATMEELFAMALERQDVVTVQNVVAQAVNTLFTSPQLPRCRARPVPATTAVVPSLLPMHTPFLHVPGAPPSPFASPPVQPLVALPSTDSVPLRTTLSLSTTAESARPDTCLPTASTAAGAHDAATGASPAPFEPLSRPAVEEGQGVRDATTPAGRARSDSLWRRFRHSVRDLLSWGPTSTYPPSSASCRHGNTNSRGNARVTASQPPPTRTARRGSEEVIDHRRPQSASPAINSAAETATGPSPFTQRRANMKRPAPILIEDLPAVNYGLTRAGLITAATEAAAAQRRVSETTGRDAHDGGEAKTSKTHTTASPTTTARPAHAASRTTTRVPVHEFAHTLLASRYQSKTAEGAVMLGAIVVGAFLCAWRTVGEERWPLFADTDAASRPYTASSASLSSHVHDATTVPTDHEGRSVEEERDTTLEYQRDANGRACAATCWPSGGRLLIPLFSRTDASIHDMVRCFPISLPGSPGIPNGVGATLSAAAAVGSSPASAAWSARASTSLNTSGVGRTSSVGAGTPSIHASPLMDGPTPTAPASAASPAAVTPGGTAASASAATALALWRRSTGVEQLTTEALFVLPDPLMPPTSRLDQSEGTSRDGERRLDASSTHYRGRGHLRDPSSVPNAREARRAESAGAVNITADPEWLSFDAERANPYLMADAWPSADSVPVPLSPQPPSPLSLTTETAASAGSTTSASLNDGGEDAHHPDVHAATHHTEAAPTAPSALREDSSGPTRAPASRASLPWLAFFLPTGAVTALIEQYLEQAHLYASSTTTTAASSPDSPAPRQTDAVHTPSGEVPLPCPPTQSPPTTFSSSASSTTPPSLDPLLFFERLLPLLTQPYSEGMTASLVARVTQRLVNRATQMIKTRAAMHASSQQVGTATKEGESRALVMPREQSLLSLCLFLSSIARAFPSIFEEAFQRKLFPMLSHVLQSDSRAHDPLALPALTILVHNIPSLDAGLRLASCVRRLTLVASSRSSQLDLTTLCSVAIVSTVYTEVRRDTQDALLRRVSETLLEPDEVDEQELMGLDEATNTHINASNRDEVMTLRADLADYAYELQQRKRICFHFAAHFKFSLRRAGVVMAEVCMPYFTHRDPILRLGAVNTCVELLIPRSLTQEDASAAVRPSLARPPHLPRTSQLPGYVGQSSSKSTAGPAPVPPLFSPTVALAGSAESILFDKAVNAFPTNWMWTGVGANAFSSSLVSGGGAAECGSPYAVSPYVNASTTGSATFASYGSTSSFGRTGSLVVPLSGDAAATWMDAMEAHDAFKSLREVRRSEEASAARSRALTLGVTSHTHGRAHSYFLRSTLKRLMDVATSDPEALVRYHALQVFLMPETHYYVYPYEEMLQSLFVALNDAYWPNRVLAVNVLRRLAPLNPSMVYPRLRKVLLRELDGVPCVALHDDSYHSPDGVSIGSASAASARHSGGAGGRGGTAYERTGRIDAASMETRLHYRNGNHHTSTYGRGEGKTGTGAVLVGDVTGGHRRAGLAVRQDNQAANLFFLSELILALSKSTPLYLRRILELPRRVLCAPPQAGPRSRMALHSALRLLRLVNEYSASSERHLIDPFVHLVARLLGRWDSDAHLTVAVLATLQSILQSTETTVHSQLRLDGVAASLHALLYQKPTIGADLSIAVLRLLGTISSIEPSQNAEDELGLFATSSSLNRESALLRRPQDRLTLPCLTIYLGAHTALDEVVASPSMELSLEANAQPDAFSTFKQSAWPDAVLRVLMRSISDHANRTLHFTPEGLSACVGTIVKVLCETKAVYHLDLYLPTVLSVVLALTHASSFGEIVNRGGGGGHDGETDEVPRAYGTRPGRAPLSGQPPHTQTRAAACGGGEPNDGDGVRGRHAATHQAHTGVAAATSSAAAPGAGTTTTGHRMGRTGGPPPTSSATFCGGTGGSAHHTPHAPNSSTSQEPSSAFPYASKGIYFPGADVSMPLLRMHTSTAAANAIHANTLVSLRLLVERVGAGISPMFPLLQLFMACGWEPTRQDRVQHSCALLHALCVSVPDLVQPTADMWISRLLAATLELHKRVATEQRAQQTRAASAFPSSGPTDRRTRRRDVLHGGGSTEPRVRPRTVNGTSASPKELSSPSPLMKDLAYIQAGATDTHLDAASRLGGADGAIVDGHMDYRREASYMEEDEEVEVRCDAGVSTDDLNGPANPASSVEAWEKIEEWALELQIVYDTVATTLLMLQPLASSTCIEGTCVLLAHDILMSSNVPMENRSRRRHGSRAVRGMPCLTRLLEREDNAHRTSTTAAVPATHTATTTATEGDGTTSYISVIDLMTSGVESVVAFVNRIFTRVLLTFLRACDTSAVTTAVAKGCLGRLQLLADAHNIALRQIADVPDSFFPPELDVCDASRTEAAPSAAATDSFAQRMCAERKLRWFRHETTATAVSMLPPFRLVPPSALFADSLLACVCFASADAHSAVERYFPFSQVNTSWETTAEMDLLACLLYVVARSQHNTVSYSVMLETYTYERFGGVESPVAAFLRCISSRFYHCQLLTVLSLTEKKLASIVAYPTQVVWFHYMQPTHDTQTASARRLPPVPSSTSTLTHYEHAPGDGDDGEGGDGNGPGALAHHASTATLAQYSSLEATRHYGGDSWETMEGVLDEKKTSTTFICPNVDTVTPVSAESALQSALMARSQGSPAGRVLPPAFLSSQASQTSLVGLYGASTTHSTVTNAAVPYRNHHAARGFVTPVSREGLDELPLPQPSAPQTGSASATATTTSPGGRLTGARPPQEEPQTAVINGSLSTVPIPMPRMWTSGTTPPAVAAAVTTTPNSGGAGSWLDGSGPYLLTRLDLTQSSPSVPASQASGVAGPETAGRGLVSAASFSAQNAGTSAVSEGLWSSGRMSGSGLYTPHSPSNVATSMSTLTMGVRGIESAGTSADIPGQRHLFSSSSLTAPNQTRATMPMALGSSMRKPRDWFGAAGAAGAGPFCPSPLLPLSQPQGTTTLASTLTAQQLPRGVPGALGSAGSHSALTGTGSAATYPASPYDATCSGPVASANTPTEDAPRLPNPSLRPEAPMTMASASSSEGECGSARQAVLPSSLHAPVFRVGSYMEASRTLSASVRARSPFLVPEPLATAQRLQPHAGPFGQAGAASLTGDMASPTTRLRTSPLTKSPGGPSSPTAGQLSQPVPLPPSSVTSFSGCADGGAQHAASAMEVAAPAPTGESRRDQAEEAGEDGAGFTSETAAHNSSVGNDQGSAAEGQSGHLSGEDDDDGSGGAGSALPPFPSSPTERRPNIILDVFLQHRQLTKSNPTTQWQTWFQSWCLLCVETSVEPCVAACVPLLRYHKPELVYSEILAIALLSNLLTFSADEVMTFMAALRRFPDDHADFIPYVVVHELARLAHLLRLYGESLFPEHIWTTVRDHYLSSVYVAHLADRALQPPLAIRYWLDELRTTQRWYAVVRLFSSMADHFAMHEQLWGVFDPSVRALIPTILSDMPMDEDDEGNHDDEDDGAPRKEGHAAPLSPSCLSRLLPAPVLEVFGSCYAAACRYEARAHRRQRAAEAQHQLQREGDAAPLEGVEQEVGPESEATEKNQVPLPPTSDLPVAASDHSTAVSALTADGRGATAPFTPSVQPLPLSFSFSSWSAGLPSIRDAIRCYMRLFDFEAVLRLWQQTCEPARRLELFGGMRGGSAWRRHTVNDSGSAPSSPVHVTPESNGYSTAPHTPLVQNPQERSAEAATTQRSARSPPPSLASVASYVAVAAHALSRWDVVMDATTLVSNLSRDAHSVRPDRYDRSASASTTAMDAHGEPAQVDEAVPCLDRQVAAARAAALTAMGNYDGARGVLAALQAEVTSAYPLLHTANTRLRCEVSGLVQQVADLEEGIRAVELSTHGVRFGEQGDDGTADSSTRYDGREALPRTTAGHPTGASFSTAAAASLPLADLAHEVNGRLYREATIYRLRNIASRPLPGDSTVLQQFVSIAARSALTPAHWQQRNICVLCEQIEYEGLPMRAVLAMRYFQCMPSRTLQQDTLTQYRNTLVIENYRRLIRNLTDPEHLRTLYDAISATLRVDLLRTQSVALLPAPEGGAVSAALQQTVQSIVSNAHASARYAGHAMLSVSELGQQPLTPHQVNLLLLNVACRRRLKHVLGLRAADQLYKERQQSINQMQAGVGLGAGASAAWVTTHTPIHSPLMPMSPLTASALSRRWPAHSIGVADMTTDRIDVEVSPMTTSTFAALTPTRHRRWGATTTTTATNTTQLSPLTQTGFPSVAAVSSTSSQSDGSSPTPPAPTTFEQGGSGTMEASALGQTTVLPASTTMHSLREGPMALTAEGALLREYFLLEHAIAVTKLVPSVWREFSHLLFDVCMAILEEWKDTHDPETLINFSLQSTKAISALQRAGVMWRSGAMQAQGGFGPFSTTSMRRRRHARSSLPATHLTIKALYLACTWEAHAADIQAAREQLRKKTVTTPVASGTAAARACGSAETSPPLSPAEAAVPDDTAEREEELAAMPEAHGFAALDFESGAAISQWAAVAPVLMSVALQHPVLLDAVEGMCVRSPMFLEQLVYLILSSCEHPHTMLFLPEAGLARDGGAPEIGEGVSPTRAASWGGTVGVKPTISMETLTDGQDMEAERGVTDAAHRADSGAGAATAPMNAAVPEPRVPPNLSPPPRSPRAITSKRVGKTYAHHAALFSVNTDKSQEDVRAECRDATVHAEGGALHHTRSTSLSEANAAPLTLDSTVGRGGGIPGTGTGRALRRPHSTVSFCTSDTEDALLVDIAVEKPSQLAGDERSDEDATEALIETVPTIVGVTDVRRTSSLRATNTETVPASAATYMTASFRRVHSNARLSASTRGHAGTPYARHVEATKNASSLPMRIYQSGIAQRLAAVSPRHAAVLIETLRFCQFARGPIATTPTLVSMTASSTAAPVTMPSTMKDASAPSTFSTATLLSLPLRGCTFPRPLWLLPSSFKVEEPALTAPGSATLWNHTHGTGTSGAMDASMRRPGARSASTTRVRGRTWAKRTHDDHQTAMGETGGHGGHGGAGATTNADESDGLLGDGGSTGHANGHAGPFGAAMHGTSLGESRSDETAAALPAVYYARRQPVAPGHRAAQFAAEETIKVMLTNGFHLWFHHATDLELPPARSENVNKDSYGDDASTRTLSMVDVMEESSSSVLSSATEAARSTTTSSSTAEVGSARRTHSADSPETAHTSAGMKDHIGARRQTASSAPQPMPSSSPSLILPATLMESSVSFLLAHTPLTWLRRPLVLPLGVQDYLTQLPHRPAQSATALVQQLPASFLDISTPLRSVATLASQTGPAAASPAGRSTTVVTSSSDLVQTFANQPVSARSFASIKQEWAQHLCTEQAAAATITALRVTTTGSTDSHHDDDGSAAATPRSSGVSMDALFTVICTHKHFATLLALAFDHGNVTPLLEMLHRLLSGCPSREVWSALPLSEAQQALYFYYSHLPRPYAYLVQLKKDLSAVKEAYREKLSRARARCEGASRRRSAGPLSSPHTPPYSVGASLYDRPAFRTRASVDATAASAAERDGADRPANCSPDARDEAPPASTRTVVNAPLPQAQRRRRAAAAAAAAGIAPIALPLVIDGCEPAHATRALDVLKAEETLAVRRVLCRAEAAREENALYRSFLSGSADAATWLHTQRAYTEELAEWSILGYMFDIQQREMGCFFVDTTSGRFAMHRLGRFTLRPTPPQQRAAATLARVRASVPGAEQDAMSTMTPDFTSRLFTVPDGSTAQASHHAASGGTHVLARRLLESPFPNTDPSLFRLTGVMTVALPARTPYNKFQSCAAKCLFSLYDFVRDLTGVTSLGLNMMRPFAATEGEAGSASSSVAVLAEQAKQCPCFDSASLLMKLTYDMPLVRLPDAEDASRRTVLATIKNAARLDDDEAAHLRRQVGDAYGMTASENENGAEADAPHRTQADATSAAKTRTPTDAGDTQEDDCPVDAGADATSNAYAFAAQLIAAASAETHWLGSSLAPHTWDRWAPQW